MADITLYGVAVSAFVAKVRIVLDLKGLRYEEREPPGGYGSADYRRIVPAGSVPGLVHRRADGTLALHDSNAIVEYLDAVAPEPSLRPEGPADLARMRALLGFHDTRVEAAARALFPLVKTDWRARPGDVDAAFAGIDAALERFGALAEPAPWLLGPRPSLADYAYPVTLQMIALLAVEMGRDVAVPAHLAEWRAAVEEVPAVQRSLTIAGEAMEAWLAGFR
ncbi:MAG: glutathione S-transferase family protein [Pseudomonadota bacterium]